MTDKVEFASPAWIEALKHAMQTRVDAASPDDLAPYAMSETYTNAPAHLAADGLIGFHVRFGPDGFEFHRQPSRYVDFAIIGEYEAVRAIARVIVDGDADRQLEMDRIAGRAIKAGELEVVGDRTNLPGVLDGVHDEVARITA